MPLLESEIDALRARAEKAERERDEARATIDRVKELAEQWHKDLVLLDDVPRRWAAHDLGAALKGE